MKHSGGFAIFRNRGPREWHVLISAALVLMLAPASWAAQTAVRERVSFNADWRFAKGDPHGTAGKLSYANIRDWVLVSSAAFVKDPNFANRKRPEGNLGADVAYTQPGFDDQGWRAVTLPHDWGIEGPFDPKAPGGTGKLPFFGIGWYRKHFVVPTGDQGRQFYLDVDGAMSYANVWLNGQYVGGWPYGYASWQVDLTPYIKFGGENVHPPGEPTQFVPVVPGRRDLSQCMAGKDGAGACGSLGNLPDDAGDFTHRGHGQAEGNRGQQLPAGRPCPRIYRALSPGCKRSQHRDDRG